MIGPYIRLVIKMQFSVDILYDIVICSKNPSAIHILPTELQQRALSTLYLNDPFAVINTILHNDDVEYLSLLESMHGVRADEYLETAIKYGSLKIIEYISSLDVSFDSDTTYSMG